MKKVLGQTGLNFIANKFKELKESLKNYYTKEEADEAFVTPLFFADKLQEADMDLYLKCSETMDTKINDLKATSTEAKAGTDDKKYMTPATTKEAIGQFASKVEVVDNLTTADSTKALSASQGKILQDNKADKSNISRCKTQGFNTSRTWQSLSTERDLEDWIGDFDKRTRELKSDGGIEFWSSEEGKFGSPPFAPFWTSIKLGNTVILHLQRGISVSSINEYLNLPMQWYPSKELKYELSGQGPRGYGLMSVIFNKNGKFSSEQGSFSDAFGSILYPFTIIYKTAQ